MDSEAVKTYRYLRLSMVGVVVLLTASVLYERNEAGCWLTSISAYYYTPVRAIFVGGLMAIALALVAIKGNTSFEDAALNTAGMLAPIVAVVPTERGTGTCLLATADPAAAPGAVEANIDNNMTALLIAGFFALALTVIIVVATTRSVRGLVRFGERGTRVGLLIAFVLLVAATLLFIYWDDFDTRAHGYAAVLMFGALAVAVALNAWAHRDALDVYFWLYALIAGSMVAAAVVVFAVGDRWDHGVLILEAIEIALFAVFWIIQTVEHWDETTRSTAPA
ncbi:MAG: hypothetical protein ACR2O6_09520 [Ilumatobacteraceae bacterium]